MIEGLKSVIVSSFAHEILIKQGDNTPCLLVSSFRPSDLKALFSIHEKVSAPSQSSLRYG
jgi:hypothetical protein